MTTKIYPEKLTYFPLPFPHWIADGFLGREFVTKINKEWPPKEDPRWRHEDGKAGRKSSIIFPNRLPLYAQIVVEELTEHPFLDVLSELCGRKLLPDPWIHTAPKNSPLLGGGLHEIHIGGRLGVHVDFEQHPTGLRRVANLLIYLNEDWWSKNWNGQLLLSNAGMDKQITPLGGRAVFFLTTPESLHGHPYPLACPEGKTRRSLALYYYSDQPTTDVLRTTTAYRKE